MSAIAIVVFSLWSHSAPAAEPADREAKLRAQTLREMKSGIAMLELAVEGSKAAPADELRKLDKIVVKIDPSLQGNGDMLLDPERIQLGMKAIALLNRVATMEDLHREEPPKDGAPGYRKPTHLFEFQAVTPFDAISRAPRPMVYYLGATKECPAGYEAFPLTGKTRRTKDGKITEHEAKMNVCIDAARFLAAGRNDPKNLSRILYETLEWGGAVMGREYDIGIGELGTDNRLLASYVTRLKAAAARRLAQAGPASSAALRSAAKDSHR